MDSSQTDSLSNLFVMSEDRSSDPPSALCGPPSVEIKKIPDSVKSKKLWRDDGNSSCSTPRDQLSEDRALFIQMEFCGMTLREWIENRTEVVQSDSWDIFSQLVSGVAYCHHRGVVHRDIKPSNVFIGDDRTVLLGDFGLAVRVAATGVDILRGTRTSRSSTGSSGAAAERADPVEISPSKSDLIYEIAQEESIAGTPLYVCPYQPEDGLVDPQVDSFSLGIVLFELFRPFGTMMERVQVLKALQVNPVDEASVLKMLLDGNEPSKTTRQVAALIVQLVRPVNRLSATALLSQLELLRKDNSPSVLKRRAELLEDDVRRLTTESEQKTLVIDAQEKKIEKLTDEQIELQMDLQRRDQQVAMLEIQVARLQCKYEPDASK